MRAGFGTNEGIVMVDYNTPVGQVRLLAGDLDTGENQIFGDDELNGFLSIANGSIKRAAADAIDVIASSEALISKVITTQDRSVDGAKTADSLRKHAESLRKRAQDEEDEAASQDEYVGIVEFQPYGWW